MSDLMGVHLSTGSASVQVHMHGRVSQSTFLPLTSLNVDLFLNSFNRDPSINL